MIIELSQLKACPTIKNYVLKPSKMKGPILGIKRLVFGHILYKATNKKNEK